MNTNIKDRLHKKLHLHVEDLDYDVMNIKLEDIDKLCDHHGEKVKLAREIFKKSNSIHEKMRQKRDKAHKLAHDMHNLAHTMPKYAIKIAKYD